MAPVSQEKKELIKRKKEDEKKHALSISFLVCFLEGELRAERKADNT